MTGDNGQSGKRPEVGEALVAALGFEPATKVADRGGDRSRPEQHGWQPDDGPQTIPDPPPPSAADAAPGTHGPGGVADGSHGGAPVTSIDLRTNAEAADSTMSPPKGKGKGPQTFDSATERADAKLESLPDSASNGTEASPSGVKGATVVANNGSHSASGRPGSGGYDPNATMPAVLAGPEGTPIDAALFGKPAQTKPEVAPTGELHYADLTGPPGMSAAPSPGTAVARQPMSANAAVARARAGELASRMPQLLEDGLRHRSQRVRARKVRRVVRHVDPWSVLTFSVLFHLCVFAALLLSSVLVWNAAVAAGTIDKMEELIREVGDYTTFEIQGDVVFRAAMVIAGILTLASSVLAVLLSVVFNLISDLVGGIRITVIEEETVRVRRRRIQ